MPLPHFLRHFFCYDPFPDMLPRRERRKPSLMYFIPIADFNPRSREGSDQWLPILFVHSKISIHAPARGATEVFRITPSMKLFQSTLPRGERHLHRCNRDCRDDFNPRSREGSDNSVKPFVIRIDSISIHAPARGATLFRNVMQLETQISIHAPARGATVKELCEIVWGEFQSTLPRGERRVFLCHVTDNRSISIHAPARGATKQAAAPFRNCSYFNPRSREWSDGNDGTNGKDGKDFNPRSREWSDARGRGGGAAEGISIHAPASGATGDEYLELLPESISIHAPASGATVIFPLSSCSVTFQSTLPRVERRRRRTQTKRLYRFQSTLPRVERLLTIRHSDRSCRFQSTLPRVERLGSV